jgi:Flp pilus assembly protein TadG
MRRVAGGESRSGQSLLEMALILPLMLLLIVNTANFGSFFYDWITVAGAVRSGAQYMALAGASVGFPPEASASQITTVIANDLKSLPNASSNVTVKVCTNNASGGTAIFDATEGAVNSSGNPIACTCAGTNGGAKTCPANEGGSTNGGNNTNGFTDPEPISYVLATVDVSYNYQPLIALVNFPGLNIYTTLPPTTIHRTAVMRMLN